MVKIFCSAAARTPGVDATGACGGGEGETDVREGMVCLHRFVQKYCATLDVMKASLPGRCALLAFVYTHGRLRRNAETSIPAKTGQ